MKRILTYTIFCLLFVLTSCSEEQLDVYNGDNYVYFTYMSDKSPTENNIQLCYRCTLASRRNRESENDTSWLPARRKCHL